jgi:hypothetical protein
MAVFLPMVHDGGNGNGSLSETRTKFLSREVSKQDPDGEMTTMHKKLKSSPPE